MRDPSGVMPAVAVRVPGHAEARLAVGCSSWGDRRAEHMGQQQARPAPTGLPDRPGQRPRGGRAAYAHLDVTSQEEWEAAVTSVVREFGGLDILVNNAGIVDLAGIGETSLADWHRTIETGQTGVFLGMKTAAAALAASGHGSVINISSVFGASGGFGTSPAYHAAKGAVRTLTKNIALHWAGRGVRVSSVHPGFINTPILDPAKGTPAGQAMINVTPLGRLGQSAEALHGPLIPRAKSRMPGPSPHIGRYPRPCGLIRTRHQAHLTSLGESVSPDAPRHSVRPAAGPSLALSVPRIASTALTSRVARPTPRP